MQSNRNLKAWYSRINKKFFLSELPQNVLVFWGTVGQNELCESDIAVTTKAKDKRHSYVIALNDKMIKTSSQKLSTLIHEMIHVATGMRDCHGPVFSEWHARLTERGLYHKGVLLKGITLV